MERPNIVFVFSDQHRAEATGFSGNVQVQTPHLDRLASQSIQMTTTVSCVPCCSPYRGSLITGQYPWTHGVFVNDVTLGHRAVSIADAFRSSGYDTAYIGKWHLHGKGRHSFIPREERHGFDLWRVLECTHQYHQSDYFGDEPIRQRWDGYDAEAQTGCAQDYLRSRAEGDAPFLLMLSWGPPHNPYETAPEQYRKLYDPAMISLRDNVPERAQEEARRDLAGYYAHITALDSYVGRLLDTLDETGLSKNTIFIYTSDHGDMLGSQGENRKQRPWDESILVPFLLRCPRQFHLEPAKLSAPFNAPDIMPTLLGLAGLPIPDTVEGLDYAPYIKGEASAPADAALIACVHPAGEYSRGRGGREYRGIRTESYTYVRDLQGPWLLYDNKTDPQQLRNLCSHPDYTQIQVQLDNQLHAMLRKKGEPFLAGEVYLEKWGYEVDETGTVPYYP